MKKVEKKAFKPVFNPITKEFIQLGKIDLALQIQKILLTGGSDDMVLDRVEKLAKQTVSLLDKAILAE